MKLKEISWKNDRITARWVTEHKEDMRTLRRMKPGLLAEACTYCETIDNPFAEELMRRAGKVEDFRHSRSCAEKGKLLRAAANMFGIRLY